MSIEKASTLKLKTRGYKLRFYPTRVQRKLAAQGFGTKRFIYNWALHEKSSQWKNEQHSLSFNDLSKQMTLLKKDIDFSWLKNVPSSILVQSLKDLEMAYKNFFNKKLAARFPTKKKKRHAQSFRMQLDQRHIHQYFSNVKGEEFLNIPGFGKLNVKFSRTIIGIPKTLTISQNSAGEYYVALSCKEEITEKTQTNRSVGVDLGIKDVAVDSEGSRYGNPKFYHKAQKKLAKHQRRFAKMKKGGSRWTKKRITIAKLQDRTMRCRKDFLHSISNTLINENQVIVLENLNVKGMMKNRKLAKALADSSLGELKRQLEYKAQWLGREILQVGRWFPSSQLCSTENCDYQNKDLSLSDRTWQCPCCNTTHDRDINAAKNILIEGLNKYREMHGALPAGLSAG